MNSTRKLLEHTLEKRSLTSIRWAEDAVDEETKFTDDEMEMDRRESRKMELRGGAKGWG